MPVESDLLEILCCPETKVDLKILTPDRIEKVNEQVKAGSVKYKDGNIVDKPLQEALITVDEKTIYRVDDEIPVMLIEMSIATDRLGSF